MSRPMILVYGPSGVGKSTAFKSAEGRVHEARLLSLDGVTKAFGKAHGLIGEGQGVTDLAMKLGPDEFLRTGIRAADELLAENPSQTLVLDVGAGFLESPLAERWLAASRSIVFGASPETAYRRIQGRCRQRGRPDDPRTLKEYEDQEFSPLRRRYYKMANHVIDAELRADEVARSLVMLILELGKS